MKKMMKRIATLTGVVAFLALMVACSGGGKPLPSAPAALQAERLALLQELSRDGIIKGWESVQRKHVDMPTLEVRLPFMLLDMDTKKKLCQIAFVYLNNLSSEVTSDDVLILPDLNITSATTGKTVGTYNPATGLRMY